MGASLIQKLKNTKAEERFSTVERAHHMGFYEQPAHPTISRSFFGLWETGVGCVCSRTTIWLYGAAGAVNLPDALAWASCLLR